MSIQSARAAIKRVKATNSNNLSLNFNQLTNIDLIKLIPQIKELTNLTSLNLSRNNLSKVDFLKELTNLTSLNLSRNNLTKVDFLKELTNLTSLNLEGNNLTKVDFLKELTNLTSLNLEGNNLTKVDFLKELTNLTSLDLSRNNLTKVDFLKELTNLTSLNLEGNNLTKVDFLKELTNLTSLSLEGNNLTNYDFLKELTNLTSLDLSRNNLTKVDFLKELTNLTSLNLEGNNLTKVDFLKELTNLTSLNLEGNDLTNFDFLKELTNLTSLSLGGNNLSKVDFLKELTNLTSLNLRGNNLTKVDFLKGLTNLTSLNLDYNLITNIDFVKSLIKLKDLRFYRNKLSEVSVLLKLKNLQVLVLMENNLPFADEILRNNYKDAPKILNYLHEYYVGKASGNLKKLNEAKLVVVGEANVGKTCVINRLIDKNFIQTNSTHGIQIRQWKGIKLANGENVQMNVWDFGGQEIMHSTHQFFFSNRTVYLLIVNARENEDTNKTEEWLQIIQSLSKNSPVFIVGNKIDENNRGKDRTSLGYFDIERKRLNEKFPHLIKGIYGITSDVSQSKYNFLFKEFEKALIKEIGQLENIHNEFPEKWFEVKDKLEKMKEAQTPFIKYDEYIDYCIQAGMENNQNRKTWVEFLNDIGVALTYSDDKNLGNYLAVLNPEWITRGVYSLIDNAQITLNKGILRKEELTQYLDQKEYPPDTQDFILNMMRKFRLLIDIKRDKTFLIPDLLPKDEPDTGVWEDVLHFQYSYEIYEKSIIRRFMVEMFGLRSKETYWRNGIVLKRGDNRALIRADLQDKTISIKIDGNLNTRREFLAIIRHKLDEIHNTFENIKFVEKAGHPKYPHILKSYQRLLKMEANDPNRTDYIEELDIDYPVKDWLDGIESESKRKRKEQSIKYDLSGAEQVTIIERAMGKVEISEGDN